MRALRLTLGGVVTLVLLGSVAGGAVAQSGEESLDPMRASQFTMTSTDEIRLDGFDWVPRADYVESLGRTAVVVVDASDPRMDGTWTQVNDIRIFPIDEESDTWASVWSAVVRLENEDGAWAGTVDGFGDPQFAREWNRLEGEGAYEGLTAIFRWEEDGDDYEGVIIPGAPPDYPAPIEHVDVAATE